MRTGQLKQQKQWDVVSKSTPKIYNIFAVVLLLSNHETPYNLDSVLSFHPPFEPILALFTIAGLWPEDLTFFR